VIANYIAYINGAITSHTINIQGESCYKIRKDDALY